MTIETKYNIGDKVWYRFGVDNICTTVRKIKVDYKGVPTYFCDFFLSTVAFREDDLFSTEEELLKSL
jgi:hypothetical protein